MDNMDISNLTYEELENLEEEIKKRKTELDAQYESLVNNVLKAINAITEAGHGNMIACYDNNGESYNWKETYNLIENEFLR